MADTEASHDDICGSLVHDLEGVGWEVEVEFPLTLNGESFYADVVARPIRGEGLWMLFEVKSHHEKNDMGAVIRQIRRYRDALGGRTLACALVTTFVPTWSQLRLLDHAGIEWVQGLIYEAPIDRTPGALNEGSLQALCEAFMK